MVTPRDALIEGRARAARLFGLGLVVLVAGITIATLFKVGTTGLVLLALVFLAINLLVHRELYRTRCPVCGASWYHLVSVIDDRPFRVRRARYCPFCAVDLDTGLPPVGD